MPFAGGGSVGLVSDSRMLAGLRDREAFMQRRRWADERDKWASGLVNQAAWSQLGRAYRQQAAKDAAKAAGWLRQHAELCRSDLYLACSDSELQAWAEKCAARCRDCFSGKEWPRDFVTQIVWCYRLGDRYGVPMPAPYSKIEARQSADLQPLAARLKCARWWLRQGRRMQARAVDQYMRARQKVAKYRQAYCSNWAVSNREKARKRNIDNLGKVTATNDLGQEYKLDELAALGVSNPAVRRNELMVRVRGFDEIAKERGHAGEFWTFTAPAKYHRMRWIKQAGKAVPVEKWNGATPRDVQAYLGKVWAEIRAEFGREGVKCYGFRVVEPHHDGTPHWHLLLFFLPCEVDKARAIARRHLLKVDGDEKGAQQSRFEAVRIDPKKGTAAGYIAKYIAKNLDGEGVHGLLAEQDDDSCLDFGNAARRVRSWASVWGIRQFQQIGGASVTVWRELRRAWSGGEPGLECDLFGSLEAQEAGEAADAGDWAAYTEAMGGAMLPRSERPLKPAYWLEESLDQETGELVIAYEKTEYGDDVRAKLFGVELVGLGDFCTRVYRWVMRREVERQEVEKPGMWGVSQLLDLSGFDFGFCAATPRLGLV